MVEQFKTHPLNIARPRAYMGPAAVAVTWPQLWAKRLAEKPELADKANFGMMPSMEGITMAAGLPCDHAPPPLVVLS